MTADQARGIPPGTEKQNERYLSHRLRCPVCQGGLSSDRQEFVCGAAECRSRFPVVDDIPVLINERNTIFSIADFQARKTTYFPREIAWKRRLLRLLPSLSENGRARETYDYFAAQMARRGGKPAVLIVGGSVVGSGCEALLAKDFTFVESDVAFGPRTSIIFDAHDIPYEDETFDGVVVQAVLEHVLDPQRVVSELHRVLKPGGVIYAETPFMQQVHGRQFDFTRFTLLGHRRLLRNFEQLTAGASCGPGMALGWAWQYFLLSFARGKMARNALTIVARFTAFWLKYFDRFLIARPAALDAASAFYFVGVKSPRALSDGELVAQYRGGF